MRKMASVRRIDSIDPIEGADAIEVATVGGWKVVIKKGEFAVGDLALYLEIDSWVPHTMAPFLSKGQEPREYNGVKGERLRTVKLRGQCSQGLLLPHSIFGETRINFFDGSGRWAIGVVPEDGDQYSEFIFEGDDVSERLGIQKYEPPIPAQLSGEVKGLFPSFIPKTDQERIQNLAKELNEWFIEGSIWEVTEKLDGSSMTVYIKDDDIGVCSRNLDLKPSDDNSFWKAAREQNIIHTLEMQGKNLALQGELIGEGIQKNPYGLRGQKFFVFDIFDIDKQQYFDPTSRTIFCKDNGLDHVPVLTAGTGVAPMEELLKIAEGKSVLNPKTEREGLVYKHWDGKTSFKVISNKFLLKGGE